jgi:hypothetical protein
MKPVLNGTVMPSTVQTGIKQAKVEDEQIE